MDHVGVEHRRQGVHCAICLGTGPWELLRGPAAAGRVRRRSSLLPRAVVAGCTLVKGQSLSQWNGGGVVGERTGGSVVSMVLWWNARVRFLETAAGPNVRLVPVDRGSATESVVAEFGRGAVSVVQWWNARVRCLAAAA